MDEGLSLMLHAVAMLEKMATGPPTSTSALRSICVASGVTGDVLRLAGRSGEASYHFRRALEISTRLLESDPKNEELQRDRASFLARLAESVGRSGNISECCDLTSKAIAAARSFAAKPNAPEMDMQLYAWVLLATPCARLRDPVHALSVVQSLVDISKRQDAGYLLMLAQAYAGTGATEQATNTLEEAAKLLPAEDRSETRRLMETAMAGYRNGVRWVPEDVPKGWFDKRRQ